MNDLVERKKKRLQFLNKMYEVTRGNANCVVMERELGRELGFTDEETDTTVQYLEGEGLVIGTGAVTIGITHHGVLEVEAALEHPDQPTKYFPPVNIIHVENMHNSQIQQAAHNSTQTFNLSVNNTQDMKAFVQQFKAQLDQIPFSSDDRAETSAELITIEAQLASPRPKQPVISESLNTIRTLLEGVAGNFVAAGLMQQLHLFVK